MYTINIKPTSILSAGIQLQSKSFLYYSVYPKFREYKYFHSQCQIVNMELGSIAVAHGCILSPLTGSVAKMTSKYATIVEWSYSDRFAYLKIILWLCSRLKF